MSQEQSQSGSRASGPSKSKRKPNYKQSVSLNSDGAHDYLMDEAARREFTSRIFECVELNKVEAVREMFAEGVPLLSEVVDERGYTLLHEACFQNHELMARVLLEHANQTLKSNKMKEFVNLQTAEQGFTALHFCSFKGNVALSRLLLENGADKFAVNFYGINMLHTAA